MYLIKSSPISGVLEGRLQVDIVLGGLATIQALIRLGELLARQVIVGEARHKLHNHPPH